MSESATCGLPYTTSQGDLGLGLGFSVLVHGQ